LLMTLGEDPQLARTQQAATAIAVRTPRPNATRPRIKSPVRTRRQYASLRAPHAWNETARCGSRMDPPKRPPADPLPSSTILCSGPDGNRSRLSMLNGLQKIRANQAVTWQMWNQAVTRQGADLVPRYRRIPPRQGGAITINVLARRCAQLRHLCSVSGSSATKLSSRIGELRVLQERAGEARCASSRRARAD